MVVEVEDAGNHPVIPVDSIPEDIVEEPVLDIREPSVDDNVSFYVKREIFNDSSNLSDSE